MKLHDVGLVIATRELELKSEGLVKITLGLPVRYNQSEDFYCPYQISGLSDGEIRYALGADAIQALQLALSKIGAVLYTSDKAQKGLLKWLGSTNLDFPVPNSIKDILPD